jgi:hypothetical protein
MKSNLKERGDVKDIIQTPIHTSFGYKRSACYINFEAQVSIVAFNAMCTYIGTGDIVQEHLELNIWPLRAEWSMPEMIEKDASKAEPD